MRTESAAVSALTVSRPSDGGQSIRMIVVVGRRRPASARARRRSRCVIVRELDLGTGEGRPKRDDRAPVDGRRR